MPKSKELKIDYKEVKAEYKDDKLQGVIEVLDEESGETSTNDINITDEIKEFLNTLSDEDKISILVKKFKPTVQKEKQPIFKYKCSCEDPREIKSKCDYLNVHCNDCNSDFLLEEK